MKKNTIKISKNPIAAFLTVSISLIFSIAILESDDVASVVFNGKKYNVGMDGVTVYFMTEKPTKRVNFNRSVYFC